MDDETFDKLTEAIWNENKFEHDGCEELKA